MRGPSSFFVSALLVACAGAEGVGGEGEAEGESEAEAEAEAEGESESEAESEAESESEAEAESESEAEAESESEAEAESESEAESEGECSLLFQPCGGDAACCPDGVCLGAKCYCNEYDAKGACVEWICDDGTCQPCGGEGEPCCQDLGCDQDLLCRFSFASPTGFECAVDCPLVTEACSIESPCCAAMGLQCQDGACCFGPGEQYGGFASLCCSGTGSGGICD